MFDSKNIFRLFSIKSKPGKEIVKLYDSYRESFFVFAKKKFSVSDIVIEDIYHESFSALSENIRNNRLNPENLKVSFKTYLFAIGKKKLYNHIRNNEKYVEISEEIDKFENPEFDGREELRRIVRQEVSNLGEPCNTVLSLFYFEGKDLKSVAEEMNYKTEQVAKNRRFLCVKTLKEIILRKYKKDDLI